MRVCDQHPLDPELVHAELGALGHHLIDPLLVDRGVLERGEDERQNTGDHAEQHEQQREVPAAPLAHHPSGGDDQRFRIFVGAAPLGALRAARASSMSSLEGMTAQA